MRSEELGAAPEGGTGERAVDSRFEMRVSATSKDRTVPGPYKETGDEGERIATPVCTLVRNDNGGTGGASPSPTKGPASGGKGRMARRLVYYCVGVLTVTAIWAAVVVTVAVWRGVDVDLSAILTFIGGAFGGELLLLLLKRVFAKSKEGEE